MMKKKFTFILIFFAQTVMAQHGYMGHKFAMGFDGFITPAFRDIVPQNKLSYAGIASTANLNFSWILKENISVAIECHFFKDYHTQVNEQGGTLVNYLMQKSIGLSLKQFKNGWIAPVGRYVLYSIMINKNDVSQDINFEGSKPYYTIKFGCGYGYQRVIFDKLLIDIGIIGYLNSDVLNIKKVASMPYEHYNNAYRFVIRDLFHFKAGLAYMF